MHHPLHPLPVFRRTPPLQRHSIRTPALTLALALLVPFELATSARAASQYFSDAGGPKSWDTTTANWGAAAGGPYTSPWTNGNTAVFEGTGGTVNVGSGASAPTFGGILFANNNYNLSGGTLNFGNNNITIQGNSTAALSGTTIGSVINGGGSSVTVTFNGVKSGSALTIRGANTYTAANTVVQVFSGGCNFNILANAGTASSFGTSGTVSLGGASSTDNLVYSGTGGVTDRGWVLNGTGSTTISNNGTGPISFNYTGNLATSTVGARTLTLGGTYTGGANTFAETINDLGTGTSLTSLKINSSIWNVTGNNSFSGGTTLIGGTMGIGNSSALGAGTLNIGGTSSFDNTTAADISVNNALSLGAFVGTYLGATHNLTINGPVTLTGNATLSVSANTLALGGQITGAFTLTKAGSGTLLLNNGGTADTHSGTTISAGTLDLDGTSQSLGAITISGASTIQNGTLTGTSFLSTLTAGYTSALVSANLAGSGAALTHSGAGTLGLFGVNAFTGGTTINGTGMLLVTNDAALGNATGGLTFGGSGFLAATNSGALVNSPVIIGSSRTITINSGITAGFQTTDTNNLIVAAYITGAGAVAQKSASYKLGAVRFSNDTNDYTGDLTLGSGTTEFTSVANLGTASSLGKGNTGTITIANGNSTGTLRYVGTNNSSTTRPLSWTGTAVNGYTLDVTNTGTIAYLADSNLRTGGSGATPLNLQGSNTGTNTLAQVINDLSGLTSVIKSGPGKWILSGANTYSGSTTVNGGALLINGSLGATTVTVATNATFGGSGGTIGGPVTIQGGGTLALGASVSTLTIQNTLTFSSTSTNVMKLSKGTTLSSDLIQGVSTLTRDGTLIVNASGDPLAAGDSFQLFSATTYSGSFDTINLPSLATGLSWDTNGLATSGELDVYSFTTTPLTISTLANTAATVSVAKMNNHATSSRGTPVATAASTPGHGTASITAGALTYTPALDYTGTDSFTVTFADGHGVQTMTVTVTINSVNAGPSLSGVDSGTGNYQITTSGLPNTTYAVQAITDGAGDWTTLDTVTAASNGVVNWTDPDLITAHTSRIYRLVQQP